jgi:AcrR family transcriptional regulator
MAKGADTRDRILEQALQLASVDGLDGLTIGRLASEVGLSKSGLFAHFRSKEELQLAVLATAIGKFAELVIRPALGAPRGEPRVRALFERWLAWERHESVPGGCVFMQLSVELDDRPGPARDELVIAQRKWLDTIARAAQIAIDTGHFRHDLPTQLFAFQLFGILSSYYHLKRLLHDESAEESARQAFEALLQWARATTPVQHHPSPT